MRTIHRVDMIPKPLTIINCTCVSCYWAEKLCCFAVKSVNTPVYKIKTERATWRYFMFGGETWAWRTYILCGIPRKEFTHKSVSHYIYTIALPIPQNLWRLYSNVSRTNICWIGSATHMISLSSARNVYSCNIKQLRQKRCCKFSGLVE